MKTVHDLDEDEFLARFNRDKHLSEIFWEVERPTRGGVELIVTEEDYQVKVSQNKPIHLSDPIAYFLAMFIGLGTVTRTEASDKLGVSKSSVYRYVGYLRDILGEDIIQNGPRGMGDNSVYYMGNITTHRPKHWLRYSGYEINTLTGCFIVPRRDHTLFTNLDTKVLAAVIRNYGKIRVRNLGIAIYGEYDISYDEAIYKKVSLINQKIIENCAVDYRVILGNIKDWRGFYKLTIPDPKIIIESGT